MMNRKMAGAMTALMLATGVTWHTPSMSFATETTSHTLTYDMTGAPVVTESGTSTTEVETLTVEDGMPQVVREAPELSQGTTVASSLRLDPCGGEIADGKSNTLSWSCLASTSFREWNTAKDGRGAKYMPGDELTVIEDTSLYIQLDSQDIVTLEELPGAVREGYIFDGWYTAKDGGTLFGRTGEKPDAPMDTLQAIADTGLYAHWLPASAVAIPDTSTPAEGDLMATGALRPDVTPLLILFVIAGALSGGFAYLSKRK